MTLSPRPGWRRLVLVSPLLLSGCGSALLDPKGQIGAEQKSLLLTSTGLMLIVVIPVIVMTLWFAWRYRHTNTLARYLPDWAHSNRIEAVVWAVPCVIILILGVMTWKSSHSLDPHQPLESDEAPLEIQAVAMDWKWLFIYPEQGVAAVNEVALPVGVPVHFRVTSASVMNALFIPQLGSQIYAMTGMDNDLYLIADEAGVYAGKSTNYSGAGYSDMVFDAHATDREAFADWIAARQAAEASLDAEAFEELAEPTRAHPVEYFGAVDGELYDYILARYQGGEPHHTAPEG